jgi:hypothetical protein
MISQGVDPWIWVLLVAVGYLPNEVWRVLGVVLGRGLDERSEIVIWVRAVATAILAGVVAKITIFAPGVLAEIPLALRLAAVAVGLAVYWVSRRSVLIGLAAGQAALVAIALLIK